MKKLLKILCLAFVLIVLLGCNSLAPYMDDVERSERSEPAREPAKADPQELEYLDRVTANGSNCNAALNRLYEVRGRFSAAANSHEDPVWLADFQDAVDGVNATCGAVVTPVPPRFAAAHEHFIRKAEYFRLAMQFCQESVSELDSSKLDQMDDALDGAIEEDRAAFAALPKP